MIHSWSRLRPEMAERQRCYKIILLGDPGVGKTTFFLRLRDAEFVDTDQRATVSIGVEDLEYKHKVGDTEIKVGTVTS